MMRKELPQNFHKMAMWKLEKWLEPLKNGTPGRIRTCYPQLRRLLLYPNELRAPFKSGSFVLMLRYGFLLAWLQGI